MRFPLRYQMMLPLAVVAVVSLLAVGMINAQRATQRTQAAIGQQVEGVVRVLANSNFPLTDGVLRQMKGLSGAEFVLLRDDGSPISASDRALADGLPASAAAVAAPSQVVLGSQVAIYDVSYFHSMVRLQRPLGTVDSGVLHVLFPRQRYDEVWRSAFLPPLIVGIVTIIAVVLVTQWVAGRISKDLTTLGASVERLAGGEFRPLVLPQRNDEVRDLVRAVNQTAARLNEYEQHVRQTEQMRTVAMLGAGLAHEMRNAATGCRLAVDLHAENCPVGCDDTLTVAKSQLQLMESRLQGFLQLGRDDVAADARQLDMTTLVSELVPLVLPAARHAGVVVDWQPPRDAFLVTGQRDTLGMVVVNLLLNAIEAAQKNTANNDSPCVGLKLMQDSSGHVELVVNDSGAGLSADVARSVFRPFVSTKPEGVGLGLAVAQQVARAHGGELGWTREENRTQFRLRLPASSCPPFTERNCTHA